MIVLRLVWEAKDKLSFDKLELTLKKHNQFSPTEIEHRMLPTTEQLKVLEYLKFSQKNWKQSETNT